MTVYCLGCPNGAGAEAGHSVNSNLEFQVVEGEDDR